MRLNLGCGQQFADGWINVDRSFPVPTGRLDTHLLDIVNDEWRWDDNSVDGIVIHHVLDLMNPREMGNVLEQCHRVLKPGAVLRVSNADLERGIERALHEDTGWFPEPIMCASTVGLPLVNLNETLGFFITQNGARKQNLNGFTFVGRAEAAGFAKARWSSDHVLPWGPGWLKELDSRHEESWFGEARK